MTHQDSSKPRPVDHEEIDQAVDEEKQTQDVVQDDSRSVQLTGHVGDVTPNPEINTPAEKSFPLWILNAMSTPAMMTPICSLQKPVWCFA